MSGKRIDKQDIQKKTVGNSNEKTSGKKIRIPIFAVLLIVVILAISIPRVYALFSDKENKGKEIELGSIEVILVEDWPEPGTFIPDDPTDPTGPGETYDEFGITKTSKVIHGESVENLDSYVRVKCIPIVEYNNETDGSGDWITAPVAQEDIVVTVTADDWVQSNGYWYYTKILKGRDDTSDDDITSDMAINWQVAEIPSEIASYPIRTDVRVILEYAQTTNNMWKEIFQISDLPEGVERVD